MAPDTNQQMRRPIGRPRTVDWTRPCAAPECPRFAAHGNGLCHACYQRQAKWGSLDAAPKRERVISACVGEGCNRAALYRIGPYCSACYQRARKISLGLYTPRPPKLDELCVGEDCDRVAIYRAGPYCGRCYRRYRLRAAEERTATARQERNAAREELIAANRQRWTALWMRYMDIAIEDADGSQYALYSETKNAILATGQLPEGAPEVERERFARAEKDFSKNLENVVDNVSGRV